MAADPAAALLARIEARTARVGVIGLGYVGLPLALQAARRGFDVIGFDIDPDKIARLEAGESYIDDAPAADIQSVAGRFLWTADYRRLDSADIAIICVPTPLTRHRTPDLSYVVRTAEAIAPVLPPGALVVLESTSYPGTTEEVLAPVFEAAGRTVGRDVFLAYSPEREDPGNAERQTGGIPKVVAGLGPEASRLVAAFYEKIVDRVVPVSNARTAEAIKITENVFRAVNIALVNELKVIYDAMGIDIWEVIDGAATKPFGYMPFYPGPGLGGHCIPIDPFYLSWKAREHDLSARFVELAGEINVEMPRYVARRVRATLDRVGGRGVKDARILIVGVAYKKNVADMRESPAVRLMDLLLADGAVVDFHDPHVPSIPAMRDYPHLLGRRSVPAEAWREAGYDLVLIATDHDAIDYAALVALRLPIVDTRNAVAARGFSVELVTKA